MSLTLPRGLALWLTLFFSLDALADRSVEALLNEKEIAHPSNQLRRVTFLLQKNDSQKSTLQRADPTIFRSKSFLENIEPAEILLNFKINRLDIKALLAAKKKPTEIYQDLIKTSNLDMLGVINSQQAVVNFVFKDEKGDLAERKLPLSKGSLGPIALLKQAQTLLGYHAMVVSQKEDLLLLDGFSEFMIKGTQGFVYAASEKHKTLSDENSAAAAIVECIATSGHRAVVRLIFPIKQQKEIRLKPGSLVRFESGNKQPSR